MTGASDPSSLFMRSFNFGELVFHSTVREVRVESGGAALGLVMAVLRILLLVAVFYAMYAMLGIRGSMIRGDVILFLVGGILLFFLHNQVVAKTLRAGDVTGPLMSHAPMTTMVAILGSAFATLYLHILAIGIIFLGMFVSLGTRVAVPSAFSVTYIRIGASIIAGVDRRSTRTAKSLL